MEENACKNNSLSRIHISVHSCTKNIWNARPQCSILQRRCIGRYISNNLPISTYDTLYECVAYKERELENEHQEEKDETDNDLLFI